MIRRRNFVLFFVRLNFLNISSHQLALWANLSARLLRNRNTRSYLYRRWRIATWPAHNRPPQWHRQQQQQQQPPPPHRRKRRWKKKRTVRFVSTIGKSTVCLSVWPWLWSSASFVCCRPWFCWVSEEFVAAVVWIFPTKGNRLPVAQRSLISNLYRASNWIFLSYSYSHSHSRSRSRSIGGGKWFVVVHLICCPSHRSPRTLKTMSFYRQKQVDDVSAGPMLWNR